GRIRIEILIESASAVERVFEIARSSRRLVGLIFGSYDYWASLGLDLSLYRHDHPLLNYARVRIVQAAATVGVPAIAEMTTNFPTRDKSEDERAAAKEEFRRDALLARDYGFVGKWTGIPDQTGLALEVFAVDDSAIQVAVREAHAFLEQERSGRGAVMIAGKMADRATDRVHRTLLKKAYALGKLDTELARELGII
ncbi:MAG TPA: aldolase/citrate lyase family protein, partial [Blastocatellia bacterium]|nr:aldolase/citrate lyase family protein [Blastocatellia bacterium]